MHSIDPGYSGFRLRETKCLLYVRNTRAVTRAQVGALLLCHKKSKQTKNKQKKWTSTSWGEMQPGGGFLQDYHLVQHAAHSPRSLLRSGNGWKVCRHTFCLLITQISLGDGILWLSCAENGLVWPRGSSLKDKLLECFCYISLFIMPERRTFIILQGSARAM